MKTKLKASGFNGALVMRIASVNEQVTPGRRPTATFDGYYDWAGAAVYAPGYLETDTVVHVVSNLYSRPTKADLVGRQPDLRSGVREVVHDRRLEGGREVAAEGPRGPPIAQPAGH